MNAVVGQSVGREQVLNDIIRMLEALKGDDESVKQLRKVHPANLAVELAKILNKHGFITADKVIHCTMNLRGPHASVPPGLQKAYNEILQKTSLPAQKEELGDTAEPQEAAKTTEKIAPEITELDPEIAMEVKIRQLALLAAGTISAREFSKDGMEESLLRVLSKVALKDGDRLLTDQELREVIRSPDHWLDSSLTGNLIDALQRRAR